MQALTQILGTWLKASSHLRKHSLLNDIMRHKNCEPEIGWQRGFDARVSLVGILESLRQSLWDWSCGTGEVYTHAWGWWLAEKPEINHCWNIKIEYSVHSSCPVRSFLTWSFLHHERIQGDWHFLKRDIKLGETSNLIQPQAFCGCLEPLCFSCAKSQAKFQVIKNLWTVLTSRPKFRRASVFRQSI